MPTSSFYNDNLYRTYPFIAAHHSVIPNEWLVGIKICFNYGGGFTRFPSVFLTDWQTHDGASTLQFSCEAEGKTVQKTVTVPANTPPFTCIVSDGEDLIRVILTVGHCPHNDIQRSNIRMQVEPTCILWLQHRGISSVQVGNRPRRTLDLPIGVEHPHYGQIDWWKQGKDIQHIAGPLLFSPGFNCRITSRFGNRLQIEAGSGAGLGEVAEDISKGCANASGIMICEEPPTDYLRRDGRPNEENVLYAFCGAVGPHIWMMSTNTILLTAETDKNMIVVSVGNLGGDAC